MKTRTQVAIAFKLARGGAWTDRIIAFLTGGRFSDVELWLEGIADYAYCFSVSQRHGGSARRIDLARLDETWVIVTLRLPAKEWTELIRYVDKLHGKRYTCFPLFWSAIPCGLAYEHKIAQCSAIIEALSACTKIGQALKLRLSGGGRVSPNALYRLLQKVQA